MSAADQNGISSVETLRQIMQKRRPTGECCDFCSTPLTPEHSHLVELAASRILCACRPCYIVFEPEGAARGKYRPVPTRYHEIGDFVVDDVIWESLQIPIGLVFFFHNSLENKLGAFYPSPAGATESLLPLDTWDQIKAKYPKLQSIKPDVEAILMRRDRDHSRCFIVPIDCAYELVGLIRTSWKGFDGGAEARAKIAAFFDKVGERSRGRVTARMS